MLVEQLSFDSWGRRRQGSWQPMTDAAIYNFDTQLTTRGYTGHEQLDPVGLVHMNGRVYDPTIGRFLPADPHVQAPTMTYDILGRMRTRIDDATAANPATRTATWIYDTQQKGIGKLTSAASPDYTATSTYDTLGRPSSSTEVIGSGLGKQTYTSSTTYDSFSRPATTAYPSGLTVRNVYDTDGALKQVTNATTNHVYWQRLGLDARGNITEFKLGNGAKTTRAHDAATGRLTRILTQSTLSATAAATPPVTYQDAHYRFDLLGNITQRRRGSGTAGGTTLTEDFVYDTLNRVTTTTTTINSAVTTAGFTYDVKGNILSKTGVGNYTYGLVDASCAAGSVAGPHAVTSIDGGTIGTKTATYCYDANGNMTAGDGRSVTYTAFDKSAQINRGTTYVRFAYGPDRARFRREDYTPIKGITTTHYVGGKAFERIITAAGAQTDKHYIGDFAVITHAGVGETAVVTTDYLHRDHLGSVEAISDTAGALVEQLSFDSWGRRRQGNWQPMTDAAIYNFDTQLTTRGFTGHEQLDPVGLVHMNGRVYDPTIGRFLSADPHVQAPGNLQNWNRYSYVMNNPLSYTDPTGFFFKKLFKSIGKAFGKVFKAIGSAFKKILRSPIFRAIIQVVGCALTAAATAGLGCVAISTGLTLAAGGSIADALQAAAFAFASMGAFNVAGGIVEGIVGTISAGAQLAADAAFAVATVVKAGVHGLVGGALAVAQGGNFLQGFIGSAAGAVGGQFAQGVFGSYGTGDFGNVVGRAAISAAVGCAGASLSGGKCANGAVTAAFASLFNGDNPFREQLTTQGGYIAKDGAKGHHWVPRAAWPANLSTDAKAMFDHKVLGVSGPLPRGFNNFDKPHQAYNIAIRSELSAYMKANSISPVKMTSSQAAVFIKNIHQSNIPAIANYRSHINAGVKMRVFMQSKSGTLRIFNPRR